MAVEDHWPTIRDVLAFIIGAVMVMMEMTNEVRDPVVLGFAGALLGIPAMAVSKRNGKKS